MGESIKELTSSNFDTYVSSGNTVIDFWAAWCGPCRIMAPKFEEASEKFIGKVKFAKLDTQKYPEIAQRYEIRSIPTILFFKDGKLIHQTIGLLDSEEIVDEINSAF